ATVKVFRSSDLASLKAHILAFVSASNFGKPLKRLQWRTPLSGHLRALGQGPGPLQDQPAPPHPGTIHPGCNHIFWNADPRLAAVPGAPGPALALGYDARSFPPDPERVRCFLVGQPTNGVHRRLREQL